MISTAVMELIEGHVSKIKGLEIVAKETDSVEALKKV